MDIKASSRVLWNFNSVYRLEIWRDGFILNKIHINNKHKYAQIKTNHRGETRDWTHPLDLDSRWLCVKAFLQDSFGYITEILYKIPPDERSGNATN